MKTIVRVVIFLFFCLATASFARAESYRITPASSPSRTEDSASLDTVPDAEIPTVEIFPHPRAGGSTRAEVKPSSPAHRRRSLSSRHGNLMTRLVRSSMNYIGVPYAWSGTTSAGFDCSGFVYRMFENFGIHLPRMADSQYYSGNPVPRTELQPGDLVFFSTYSAGISHVGIYIGNNRFIHSSSSRGVTVSDLGESYYRARYIGACRL